MSASESLGSQFPNTVKGRQDAKEAAPYKLVSRGRGSVHIEGIGSRGNYGASSGVDTGKGWVGYAPESSCAGLTRLGANRWIHEGYDDLKTAARHHSAEYHGNACKTCADNAHRALEA